MSSIDILAVDRGTITAPAGCGKTHLIADALTRHTGSKPVLVLTHTNAGVAALRGRLNRAHVPSNAYRLSTIDGWAMRIISTFPIRSEINPTILLLQNPGTDYPAIREAAIKLLRSENVNDILQASYSRIIVDEYQDCSMRQHAIVTWAAQILPTCVLGDPLQAIFGFGSDGLARWNEDVCTYFPIAGELDSPWRWVNANAEPLGRWLLDARRNLWEGRPIDLRTAPSESVKWVELDGTEDHKRQLLAARVSPPDGSGCVLIIGESTNPASQHKIASQTPGAITVEAVDLKDLVSFARQFKPNKPGALGQLAQFAQSVMTNVGADDLVSRVQSLTLGTARKPPSQVEQVALVFLKSQSYRAALDLLVEINKEGGVRAHRPAVLKACIRALQLCGEQDGVSFHDAAIRIREQSRLTGRPLPKRAVGSTLLLKGLESEVAVILNADGLNAANLYVAMTRGSRLLVICSKLPVLNPGRGR